MALVEGGPCQSYLKNGWKPGVLVTLGRKWAVVKFNGQTKNSHVSVGAVRELKTGEAISTLACPAVSETESKKGYHLIESEDFWKLFFNTRLIAVIVKAYTEEADIILNAMLESKLNYGATQAVKAPEPVAVKAPEPVAVKAPEPVAVKAPEPVVKSPVVSSVKNKLDSL